MQKRLFGLLAIVMLIMAACGGQTQSQSASAAASEEESTPASESAEASASASASGEATDIDSLLYGSDYAPEEGTPGGDVVIADWQQVDELNPYYSNAFVNSQVIASTMRGLYTVSNDLKWHPDLGETVPSISGGQVVIDDEVGAAECPTLDHVDTSFYPEEATPGFTVSIDIKPDLVWSDGEPLDLNDLAYTVEWILDPEQVGLSSGTTGWDLIDSFEVAEDGLSADVHFCRGYASWLATLGTWILPEHYMSEIPVADAVGSSYPVAASTVDAPVNGPFQYASVTTDTIELVRNESFNAGVSGDPHPAYLDRVVYRFFAGEEDAKGAMIAAFLNGEIDVATDMLQGDFASISSVNDDDGDGLIALIELTLEREHLDLNQADREPGRGHPALADANVRTALGLAVDPVALYETVYPGVPLPDEPACSYVPPGLFYRTTEGLSCLEYDIDEAVRLLDESGWVDTNDDGIRDKDGVELNLLHCHTGAAFRVDAGDFLASAFRDIGVGLANTSSTVIFSGWASEGITDTTECNLARGNYDTAEFAYVYGFDPFGAYFSYHSSQIPTDENDGAGVNYLRLNEPEMDDILNQMFGATDPNELVPLAEEFQVIFSELNPEISLYYRSAVRGLSENLLNYARNGSTASDMWNIEDWYLSE